MRIINMDANSGVRLIQLYLTPNEASEFRNELDRLLAKPESNDHSHITSEDLNCELSFSIITENKLKNIKGYTKLEQRILTEK
jgi:hypothetical protein